MIAYLDDERIAIEPRTLSAALDTVRARAGATGRVVIEALLNGRPISDSELAAPEQVASEDAQLEFRTLPIADLAADALRDAARILREVTSPQQEAGALILECREAEAVEPIRRAMTGWGQVQLALQQTLEILGVPMDQPMPMTQRGRWSPNNQQIRGRYGAGSIGSVVHGLQESLTGLKRALADRDWVSVRDVLDTELQQSAESWQEMLDSLVDGIASGALNAGRVGAA